MTLHDEESLHAMNINKGKLNIGEVDKVGTFKKKRGLLEDS